MKQKYYYYCIKCNKKFYKFEDVCSHDPYYEYIDIIYDYQSIKQLPKEKRLAALCSLLPLETQPFYIGEGNTPLIKINNFYDVCGDNDVYVKNEGQNPTGSFKDRESAVIVEKAKELGYKKVSIVSSGNAALSAAIYANKANIECKCFIPQGTSKAKLQMLKLYNADYHLMKGDYEMIYRKMIDHPIADYWNITGGQNFFRSEGDKMISYEIWEKIGVPDMIIVPIGNGALFSSVHKGFLEIKKVGLSNKMPKLIGVQIKNAAPVAKALRSGLDYSILQNVPYSVAEGIVARESYSSLKVIKAIKEGAGDIVEVSENETKSALKEIIKKESLTPEPTSAVIYAVLKKINVKNKTIVCIQTGNGMKNLEEILEIIRG